MPNPPTPPVPPRPVFDQPLSHSRQQSLPPPIPPLPLDFHPTPYDFPPPLQPHLEQPMLAPKPHKLMDNVPNDITRQLNDSLDGPPSHQSTMPSAPHPNVYQQYPGPGGFRLPPPGAANSLRGPSPAPPPPGAFYPPPPNQPSARMPPSPQPWTPPQLYGTPTPVTHTPPSSYTPPVNQLENLSLGPGPRPPHHRSVSDTSLSQMSSFPGRSSPRKSTQQNSLQITLPTIQSLSETRSIPDSEPHRQVPWARDVFFLVERTLAATAPNHASDNATGAQIQVQSGPAAPRLASNPALLSLAQQAAGAINRIAPQLPLPTNSNIQPWAVEAIFLKGKLASNGYFPDLIPPNPREAFRLFEAAARAGYARAWFQIGRDYEGVGDFTRAKDCFERGVRNGVESCSYRMGMAHLLGQLTLPSDPQRALQLLQQAAQNASIEVPQPAYVYALILLSEFPAASGTIPPSILPPQGPRQQDAKYFLERAAYLGFAPAQYKLGHAYEYALPPFHFDALLSVQYYSSASQQGEEEADMALSKWFLCGSEGAGGFEKDEGLALVFAEKAARKGLPTAMFAMGYYAEVGVGRTVDLAVAADWYERAAENGNQDAKDRLAALSQPTPQTLSRQQHESLTDVKLVRRRTQARNEAPPPPVSANIAARPEDAEKVVGAIRRESVRFRNQHVAEGAPPLRGRGRGRGLARGAGSIPAPRPAQSTQQPPHHQNTMPAQLHDPPVRPNSSGSKPPATFAEMGFHSTKLESKECIIM